VDAKEKKLLKETAELARENQKLIKKVRRAQLWGRAFRIIYWVIILGVTFGAYYFIQPFVEQFLNIYEGISGGIDSVQNVGDNLPDLSRLSDFLRGFSSLLPGR